MGTKRAALKVDPLSLPEGMRVGPWRVVGWGGRGVYGTVYRVVRAGREAEGPFALKLAIYPGDERFEREGWLLSRIHSPHVPRLYDQGGWEHPAGAFPYLVTEWVEGEPLYDWSARHNPTPRQAFVMVAQVARALEATHAVGGVHRDVKGTNVLVRVDGQVFLTDFGAGYHRGAATLTTKLLPPSTPAYRSPEAWGFVKVFRRHPTAHYPASASDDLFALGVMAYRLMTDEYPPLTQPEEPGAEVWREGGPGPRPPRELNPRVSPEMEAVIQRLLAIAPVERFEGMASEAVRALEQATQDTGPEGELPLFSWGHHSLPRWRSPGGVRLAEERDAAARQEFERQQQAEARARSSTAKGQARPGVFARARSAGVAVACLTGVLALIAIREARRESEVEQVVPRKESRDEGRAAVGDSAQIASAAALKSGAPTQDMRPAGAALPEKPLPGQRKPPCNQRGEAEIRGGCWYRIGDTQPPCAENAYDWNGACYVPSLVTRRQPAADLP